VAARCAGQPMNTRRALLAGLGIGAGALALGAFQFAPFGSPFGDAPRRARRRDQGQAPELAGVEGWINAEPTTLSALRGRVVLLEFWAFACSNCIRTIPHLRALHQEYQAQGLTVIGVHTPEFPRERIRANVEAAVRRWRVDYPVALDPAAQTWRAYDVRAWPTRVLIDRRGHIVLRLEGEGEDDAVERLIRAELARA